LPLNYPIFIGARAGTFIATGMDIDSNSDIVFGGFGSDLNFEVFSSVTGNNKASS
jgi:hypothetical protein